MLVDSAPRELTTGATPPAVDPRAGAKERRRAVKLHLSSLGLTISKWADRHGYARKTVYRVLSGDLHGHYGVTHNIAIRLGLKEGEIDPTSEPAPAPVPAHD